MIDGGVRQFDASVYMWGMRLSQAGNGNRRKCALPNVA